MLSFLRDPSLQIGLMYPTEFTTLQITQSYFQVKELALHLVSGTEY